MDDQQKVLWTDGMFLTPHHFQQWDRHHQAQAWQRQRAVQPLGYGFTELRIDEDALAVGDLVVTRCSGVMQDGLVFDCPGHDDPPPTRQLAGLFDAKGSVFDARREGVSVYLAAPLVRPGIRASSADGLIDGNPTRYRSSTVVVRDETTASNERELVTAKTSLRLLLEGESRDNYTWIKLGELGRTAGGRIAVLPSYIPPCIHLGASERLQTLLRRTLETLSGRSSDLSAQRRNRGAGVVDFAMAETATFALLTIVNTAIPAIRHCYSQPGMHPERMYVELARLVGALYTFAGEGHPKDLPLYVHDDLGGTFTGLDDQLRSLLNVVIPTRCLRLPLKQVKDTLFAGEIGGEDEELTYYLAVFASVRPEKLIHEVPLKAKVATPQAIDFLVAQALRGLGLQHLPTPPPELPISPDWQYFRVLNVGEQWKEVQSAKQIAFYLPPEFKGLRLELLAVRG